MRITRPNGEPSPLPTAKYPRGIDVFQLREEIQSLRLRLAFWMKRWRKQVEWWYSLPRSERIRLRAIARQRSKTLLELLDMGPSPSAQTTQTGNESKTEQKASSESTDSETPDDDGDVPNGFASEIDTE